MPVPVMILDNINKPNDIKKIPKKDMPALAEEIRQFMVEHISKTGGHLASSLGTVELTMALHICFNLPKDKIIWDVGHQSYTHKILTGRKDGFDNIRSYEGMSGFPKRSESDCDAFNTGHSTTSISAGLGLARARNITGDDYKVISVIGDGSLTGGMAYEALNNAGTLKGNFIIVLNDNNMSISENVGNVSRMMSGIRTAPSYIDFKGNVKGALGKIPKVGDHIVRRVSGAKNSFKQLFVPGMFFEDLGLTYLGPVDGHNIPELVEVFRDAKRLNRAVVVHVMTKKGKGYEPAEDDPSRFHGIGKFDIDTGESLGKKGPDYSKIFGEMICKLAHENNKIACITAAMPEGVGLKNFAKNFPNRFFDVGIAEEHAVTFAAGLAVGGLKPYVCVYSSFLQRAYDQIVHDVCMQDLPVTFIVDRAGIVGADGETHQGLLDVSFLTSIPGMTVMSPKNALELIEMLRFSESFNGPLAIRFPRGEIDRKYEEYNAPIELGRFEELEMEKDIVIVSLGTLVSSAMEARELLKKDGYKVSVVNARFAKPVDEDCIRKLAKNHKYIFTLEENEIAGGFGEHVAAFAESEGLKSRVIPIGVKDEFVTHGSPDKLKEVLGLDGKGVYEFIKGIVK